MGYLFRILFCLCYNYGIVSVPYGGRLCAITGCNERECVRATDGKAPVNQ